MDVLDLSEALEQAASHLVETPESQEARRVRRATENGGKLSGNGEGCQSKRASGTNVQIVTPGASY